MATFEEATEVVRNRKEETECWHATYALTHASSKQV